MPLSYWSYAFATVVYLINRLPTHTLQFLSLYAKLFGNYPNYSKLCSFGCLCYPWLHPYAPHKLASRSSSCVFIGYSTLQSAYLYLDLTSSQIYTSRHIKFVESIFPFTSLWLSHDRPSPTIVYHWYPIMAHLPIIGTPSLDSTYATPSLNLVVSNCSLMCKILP